MNPHQEIKNTENSIRDFLVENLRKKYGASYEDKFGVSDDRVKFWKQRLEDEKKKHPSATVEQRLIYYSDFYDLNTIIKKNWDIDAIKDCFGKQKKVEYYLNELDKYRNTTAHNRDFLTHQEHLIFGICGELRSKIVIYRNMEESLDNYFPRIEIVRDNLGNFWKPGSGKNIFTKKTLKPGDILEFTITAVDPENLPLKYYCSLEKEYSEKNKFSITITDKEIGLNSPVSVGIRSSRDYRKTKGNEIDEWVTFYYNVIPNRK